MLKTEIHTIGDLEFKVKYSSRRTIAISVLPDSSVIVRVPSHYFNKEDLPDCN